MAESVDCVVVGAGWFGLAAAKVYLELHPTENIVVLEQSGSCGGTWSEDRIYPSLKSNNLHGTYEYPDFPMDPAVYGVHKGQHIPGAVLHRYLTDFAKKVGVFGRIRFHTRVESITTADNGFWKLSTTPSSGALRMGTLQTRRLIVASGLTSTPNIPTYPGQEGFKGRFFHAKDFCRNGETVKTAEHVVVIGGGKSAYDVAYASADAGAKVDIVIRPTGKGPVWIAQPYVDFGLQLEKLLHVRFLTCFSPCPWGAEAGYSWFRNFLHGTAFGRWLVSNFWNNLGGSVIAQNGYASNPELKKLQPWDSAFWIGSGLSIHNYEHDFFDMVKTGKIRVNIADVARLTVTSVELTTGESIEADVVVCSTGWKKESSIKYSSIELGLGVPEAEKAILNARTDQEIFTLYPRLKDQPPVRSPAKASDPYRMYRFMVPPTLMDKHNIAFAGMVSSATTSICANTQALWISAFFDGKLNRQARTKDEITHEVMLHTQWGKWRHPTGYGADLPDVVFDALSYIDLLLNDLGVKVNRKPNGFKELFAPYGPGDFVGIVDEWKETHS